MAKRISLRWMVGGAAVLALLLWCGGAVRAASQDNAAGATVEAVTTEADSGAMVTNDAGATLELVTSDQTSLDSLAPSTARLFVGLLEPYLESSSAAGKAWALYE